MCYQTGYLFGSVFTSHNLANLIYFIIFHSIILSTTIAKKYQYRKYKEVYKVNLTILKRMCQDCDILINKHDMDKLQKHEGGYYAILQRK